MRDTFHFTSHSANLAEVRSFVRKFLLGAGVSECDAGLLVLGVDEACSNVVRHAYPGGGSEPVVLRCLKIREIVRFTLRDFGTPVDPGLLVARQLEDIRPGGLGMHFIRHVFDSVEYRIKPAGTELVMLKRLVEGVSEQRSRSRSG